MVKFINGGSVWKLKDESFYAFQGTYNEAGSKSYTTYWPVYEIPLLPNSHRITCYFLFFRKDTFIFTLIFTFSRSSFINTFNNNKKKSFAQIIWKTSPKWIIVFPNFGFVFLRKKIPIRGVCLLKFLISNRNFCDFKK